MLATFEYTPDVLALFPDIAGGILTVPNVRNAPTPPELQTAFQAEQGQAVARIGSRSLSEIPALAAWRAAFLKFGVDPTQYRSAAEALLRRVTKQGEIPSINTLVDLGNLVSVRYALPVAIVDRQGVHGGIRVCFADGDELFTDHGQSQSIHPEAGEVIFRDEQRAVVARRWCWRQSLPSTATLDTTDVLITVEAQHAGGDADIARALADLQALLVQYAGVEADSITHAILTKEAPAI